VRPDLAHVRVQSHAEVMPSQHGLCCRIDFHLPLCLEARGLEALLETTYARKQ